MKTQMTFMAILMAILPISLFAQKNGEAAVAPTTYQVTEVSPPPHLVRTVVPPPPEKRIYHKVDRRPLFSGCSNFSLSEQELIECSETELAKFVQGNLTYPQRAKKKKAEGTVLVSCVIEKDGSISQIEIKRDFGKGCWKEAFRIVESMPKWTPGQLNGQRVRTYLEIPIEFELD